MSESGDPFIGGGFLLHILFLYDFEFDRVEGELFFFELDFHGGILFLQIL